KSGAVRHGGDGSEQRRFDRIKPRLCFGFGAEDFAEVLMNRRVVVHDENARRKFRVEWSHTIFLVLTGGWFGSKSVNVAPAPGPSLLACSEPPSSRTASALLCRPNPWPSLRVVNPWPKIRVMFSSGMPMPLSTTSIFTEPLGSGPTFTVSSLSSRRASSMAYL